MDKSESQIGEVRKGTTTSQQILLYEEEGANPDSVRGIWTDSESNNSIEDYRIKYPPSKDD